MIYELETNDNSEEGIRRCYAECLEEVKLADTLGFKTVWFTEHHFLDRFSYSSAPDVWLSYLAANTKNIRLGHGIVLLPFKINHPLRVAERAAVLDLVSGGRLDFGGGRAISDSELSAFDVHPDDTRPQWLETLADAAEDVDPGGVQLGQRADQDPAPHGDPQAGPEAASPDARLLHATVLHRDRRRQRARRPRVRDRAGQVQRVREDVQGPDPAGKPVGEFVNNRFCQMVATMCAPTDEEALALRGPDFTMYNEAVQQLFTPWLDGNAPASYSWIMEYWERTTAADRRRAWRTSSWPAGPSSATPRPAWRHQLPGRRWC